MAKQYVCDQCGKQTRVDYVIKSFGEHTAIDPYAQETLQNIRLLMPATSGVDQYTEYDFCCQECAVRWLMGQHVESPAPVRY